MKYTIYRHETGFMLYRTSEHFERMYTPIIRTNSETLGIAALKDLRQREPKRKGKRYYEKYMY